MRIGQASIDERGSIRNGQSGNQNGRELNISSWYQGNWTLLIRPSSKELGERMAKACEAACRNRNIGYDQMQRNTLRNEARKVKWDLGAIEVPCETDCSAFMSVCAEAAGVKMDMTYTNNNAPCTFNMEEMFSRTREFQMLRDKKYLRGNVYLRRGDILVDESKHTVMVLDDGPMANGKNSEIIIERNGVQKRWPIDRQLIGGRNYFQIRELVDLLNEAGVTNIEVANLGNVAVLRVK